MRNPDELSENAPPEGAKTLAELLNPNPFKATTLLTNLQGNEAFIPDGSLPTDTDPDNYHTPQQANYWYGNKWPWCHAVVTRKELPDTPPQLEDHWMCPYEQEEHSQYCDMHTEAYNKQNQPNTEPVNNNTGN